MAQERVSRKVLSLDFWQDAAAYPEAAGGTDAEIHGRAPFEPETLGRQIVGGTHYAEIKMESEHHLHIRAAAGEPAAHLPLRHDHRGCPHGLRKDHGGELVS